MIALTQHQIPSRQLAFGGGLGLRSTTPTPFNPLWRLAVSGIVANPQSRPAREQKIKLQLLHANAPPDLSNSLQKRFRDLGSWEAGWDGDDADPVSPAALQAGKQLLIHLLQQRLSLREPEIVPTLDGQIQLEWHDSDRSLEFGFSDQEWVALGVEIPNTSPPIRHTALFTGKESDRTAAECYDWFVRRDDRRTAWPLR